MTVENQPLPGPLQSFIEVGKRAEYLLALEEANVGRCRRFADFVLQSVERSIRRLIGEDETT